MRKQTDALKCVYSCTYTNADIPHPIRRVNACLATHQISQRSIRGCYDMKKGYARTLVQCALLLIPAKRIAHGPGSPNHKPNFSAARPVVPEIRKRGVHVLTYSCAPPSTFVKRLGNRLLTTYQISAQSVSSRYRDSKKGALCSCAHVHVQRSVAATFRKV